MLRRSVAVIALVVLFTGESFAGGLIPFLAHQKRWAQPGTGCNDDSPLCPNLSPYILEQSHCKMPLPCHPDSRGSQCQQADTGIPYFPPLPYSYRAAGYQPGMNMGASGFGH
jgi:hypothetical protein